MGLTKSVRLLFWCRHFFLKCVQATRESQIFGLFRHTYFMDGPFPFNAFTGISRKYTFSDIYRSFDNDLLSFLNEYIFT